jgi:hypothetical protein
MVAGRFFRKNEFESWRATGPLQAIAIQLQVQEKAMTAENWPPRIDPLFLDLPGLSDNSGKNNDWEGNSQITLSGNVLSSTAIEYLQAHDTKCPVQLEIEDELEVQRANYRMGIITEVCFSRNYFLVLW